MAEQNTTSIDFAFNKGDTVFYIVNDEILSSTITTLTAVIANTTSIYYTLEAGATPIAETDLSATAEDAAEKFKQKLLDNFNP